MMGRMSSPYGRSVVLNAPPADQGSEIVIGGSRHLPAREIARTHGYVPGYIARLCREGKVRGHQLRGIWYVDTESFAAFVRGQAQSATLSPASAKEISNHRV
jgi:hypothetical protein